MYCVWGYHFFYGALNYIIAVITLFACKEPQNLNKTLFLFESTPVPNVFITAELKLLQGVD